MKPFKLQEITQMKLKCMSLTQSHLVHAQKDKHPHEILACEKELVALRYEAMHPQTILDKIQKYGKASK